MYVGRVHVLSSCSLSALAIGWGYLLLTTDLPQRQPGDVRGGWGRAEGVRPEPLLPRETFSRPQDPVLRRRPFPVLRHVRGRSVPLACHTLGRYRWGCTILLRRHATPKRPRLSSKGGVTQYTATLLPLEFPLHVLKCPFREPCEAAVFFWEGWRELLLFLLFISFLSFSIPGAYIERAVYTYLFTCGIFFFIFFFILSTLLRFFCFFHIYLFIYIYEYIM